MKLIQINLKYIFIVGNCQMEPPRADLQLEQKRIQ